MIRIRRGVGNGIICVITLYPPTEESIIPHNIIYYYILYMQNILKIFVFLRIFPKFEL